MASDDAKPASPPAASDPPAADAEDAADPHPAAPADGKETTPQQPEKKRGRRKKGEAQAEAAPGELQGWDGRDAWAVGVGGSRVVHKGHGPQAADISQATGTMWRAAPGRRPRPPGQRRRGGPLASATHRR